MMQVTKVWWGGEKLMALALIIFWSGFIWLGFRLAPTERVIDCSMAEFHPDFTPEVRKACRERRGIKL